MRHGAATAAHAPAASAPAAVPQSGGRRVSGRVYTYKRDGVTYAGRHLTIDLWEATGLDDEKRIQQAFHDAIKAAGATLLHIHTHVFTPNGGVSGVAVLSESHISVHTWPEKGFAAFDVFMCGDAQPELAVPVLEAAFKPKRVVVEEIKRGVVEPSA